MLIAKIGALRESSTATGFVTQWEVSGDATARTITLPLIETRSEGALSYNCTIDWGDGSGTSTVTAFDDADRIHTYASDGTYEVTITGTCEGWSFNNAGDKLKITKVINFGDTSLFDGFKYLKSGFYGCTNLTDLGTTPIPASGTGCLTDGFESTFENCVSLTAIPTGLFDLHTQVTTSAFRSTFENCDNALTSIPSDLFKYNTLVSVDAFYITFRDCTSLTSIPADLFRYNTAVSGNGFRLTFDDCASLTSIPTDLFRYNTLVDNFEYTFNDCDSLTSIPTDLFRYNTAVTNFEKTFFGCKSLETVPEYLFRYNVAVTGGASFDATFANCDKLQLNSNIFCDEATEKTTRFNNQSPDFETCFYRTSFTGTQGTAPELWDYTYGTGTPVTTNCFGGTGNSGTSLDNYGDIPTAWGGVA